MDHLASTTTAETLHQLLVSDDMGDTIRMPTDCSTSRSRDVHCIEKLDSSAVHSAMDALDGTGRGAFLFLAAFSVAAVALSPFAAAAGVRLNLGS